MDDQAPRYAIQGTSDKRRIELPTGGEFAGVRRHAVEHAAETCQSVLIEEWEVDGWVVVKTVDYPFPPTPADVMLGHYSRALDEIYRLRIAAAYGAYLAAEANGYSPMSPQARRCIRHGRDALRQAARGEAATLVETMTPELVEAVLEFSSAPRSLTRSQWEETP